MVGAVSDQILLECEQGVRLADVADLSRLRERHEAVACASLAVAGRAVAGDIAVLAEPGQHLVRGAFIGDLELRRVRLFRLADLLVVAADAGARARAHLGDAEVERYAPRLRRLSRREDHPRVGGGNADDGDDAQELFVGWKIGELLHIDALGLAHARHGDSVGSDAAHLFQRLRIEQLGDSLVFIVVEPIEHARAHVVDAALLRAVQRRSMPVVIALRPLRVHLRIGGTVESLLEEDEGPDIRGLQPPVFLNGGRRDVDVDAAYRVAAAVLIGVDAFHTLDDVVEGDIYGVLSGLHRDTLVAEGEDRVRLLIDLLHRQLLAAHRVIAGVEAAVNAAVDAVVSDIERREEHDAPAVDALLDLLRKRVELMFELRVVNLQQHRRLTVGEAVAGARLVQNGTHRTRILCGFFCLRKRT